MWTLSASGRVQWGLAVSAWVSVVVELEVLLVGDDGMAGSGMFGIVEWMEVQVRLGRREKGRGRGWLGHRPGWLMVSESMRGGMSRAY